MKYATTGPAAWLAVGMLVCACSGTAAAQNRGIDIRDPHYGEVLFHFYQQDEFTALTHLLAAQQAGRVTQHAAEAELLLGGLYLSYGQIEQATQIFDRLLVETSDPAVRDRAWYFIGKAHYQRGLYAEADRAFARVAGNLPDALLAEY